MPQSRSRRITIAVLSVLTILLLGLAVFIAFRLQTPDTGVAVCNNAPQCSTNNQDLGCQGGGNPFRCKCVAVRPAGCDNDILVVNCGTPDASCGGGSSSSSSSSSSSGGGGTCTPGTTVSVGACGCQPGRRTIVICNSQGQPQSTCQVDTTCSSSSSSSGGSSSSSSGGSGTCTPNYFTSGSNGQIANVSIPDTAACDGQTFTFVKFTGPANSGTCSENQVGGTGTTYPLTRGQSQSQEAGCGQCAQIDGTNGTTGGIRANNTSCTGSSSSSSSSSSGTSSSGGDAYTCNSMTRIPTGSPLPPGQTVSVQVTETSATANNAACVFLVDGSNAQVAQSTRTGGPTAGPNNTWTHNYNIAIPGGAANGNYSLRYSRSCAMGALEAAAACQQAFTVTAGVQENPALSLIKSSAVVTLPNGNANVNYTITITNSGNVAATISPVVDVLPVQVTSASQVTSTNPQASQITADAITWNGPFTVNPNSSIQFTYTLSFTAAEIAAFTSNQLINTVTITYNGGGGSSSSSSGGGGGTLSFTLLTLLGALPATGLFDEPAGLMVVGLILIMIGLIINRSGILLNLFGAGVGSTDATTKLVESFLRGETEENRKDKFAAKVVSQQEKKYRK
ncbi:MAG: hypothetical protein JNK26_02245 [Candidatus Doudnabacteria bacterium]|nr:hypothetical protein [Candidatus Doudnabacteria bacterium]